MYEYIAYLDQLDLFGLLQFYATQPQSPENRETPVLIDRSLFAISAGSVGKLKMAQGIRHTFFSHGSCPSGNFAYLR
jgi:hypothetical protein